jgi:hypothetical protein
VSAPAAKAGAAMARVEAEKATATESMMARMS